MRRTVCNDLQQAVQCRPALIKPKTMSLVAASGQRFGSGLFETLSDEAYQTQYAHRRSLLNLYSSDWCPVARGVHVMCYSVKAREQFVSKL